MKFYFKVFLCTIILFSIAFSIGGFLLINSVFNTNLDRETKQSLEDSKVMMFIIETSLYNIPSKYDELKNSVILDVANSLETSNLFKNKYIKISDIEFNQIYSNFKIQPNNFKIDKNSLDTIYGKIIKVDNLYFFQSYSLINIVNKTLIIETLKDISWIFDHRTNHFITFQKLTIVVLSISSIIMLIISIWLTKPIKDLKEMTKLMASGNFTNRVIKKSGDEIGELGFYFNIMAEKLEEKIFLLEESARQQEEFVGNFAHELKTPLTSIIGYADMLRSYQMDDEKRFLTSNYIFNEGKRLESLSLKLMNIIILKEENIEKKLVSTKVLVDDVVNIFFNLLLEKEICLKTNCKDSKILIDPDLIKTVLINLIDNAQKVSQKGSEILLNGMKNDDKYIFTITDYGIGIPEDEINKIVEPFYMVDKSRSRSQNGAGLGLALCALILKLHDSKLDYKSELDVGTTVSFII